MTPREQWVAKLSHARRHPVGAAANGEYVTLVVPARAADALVDLLASDYELLTAFANPCEWDIEGELTALRIPSEVWTRLQLRMLT